MVGLVLVLVALFRLFYLPGVSFNQNVWDDEISWINDSNDRSTVDFILYRDAPGYFVFIPRIIILLGNIFPVFETISILRIQIIIIQLLCYAAAAACVASYRAQWRIWLIVFLSLSVTYVEDLNYVHNVGYIFIFPIFYLVFMPLINNKSVSIWRLTLGSLLICKPFTAVLIILLTVFFIRQLKTHVLRLSIFGLYCLMYLAAYALLPNRWSTPLSSDPFTIVKAIVNLPWVVFASLNPLISIGGMGFVRFLDTSDTGFFFIGAGLYGVIIVFLLHFQQTIRIMYQKATLLTKSLSIIFLVNYILVYSANNSYWVKYFPLFRLEYPHHMWMRWSTVLPFVAILIIASIQSPDNKLKKFFYPYMIFQWLILSLTALPWLKRYW
jgi:hypothetical protein